MNNTDLIIYLHHPKAGGSSIRKWFTENLDCPDITPYVWEELSLEERNEIPFLCGGHLRFGEHTDITVDEHRTIHYVTVVREPIARLVSIYYFHKYIRKELEFHPLPILLKGRNYDLNDFLKYAATEHCIINEQTERMSGHHCAMDQRSDFSMDNICKCSVVGVHDDLPGFLNKCRKKFDIKETFPLPHINESDRTKPEEVLPEVMDYLKFATHPDQRLFNKAVSLSKESV